MSMIHSVQETLSHHPDARGAGGQDVRELRRRCIQVAAYYLAEHRGFQGGDPVADWLWAEAHIDALIAGDPGTNGLRPLLQFCKDSIH